jgi:hypothetical protein
VAPRGFRGWGGRNNNNNNNNGNFSWKKNKGQNGNNNNGGNQSSNNWGDYSNNNGYNNQQGGQGSAQGNNVAPQNNQNQAPHLMGLAQQVAQFLGQQFAGLGQNHTVATANPQAQQNWTGVPPGGQLLQPPSGGPF